VPVIFFGVYLARNGHKLAEKKAAENRQVNPAGLK